MREYTTISVPPELLPQVLRQLFAIAADPNLVDVNDGPSGRVIMAHPAVAEAWYSQLMETPSAPAPEPEPAPELEPEPEPEPQSNTAQWTPAKPGDTPGQMEPELVTGKPEQVVQPLTELQINGTDVPVKRGRGRPRKVVFSASNGEES